VVNEQKLRRVLAKMLDETEFLDAYGIRSLSQYHRDHLYVFTAGHDVYRVAYEPAESTTRMFGGNSNWRGPIWFPTNALIIWALINLYTYYGDAFRVECPTGSGRQMTLFEVAQEITRRLISIFLRGPTAGVRSSAGLKSSRAIPIGGTACSFTSTFTATTAPASVRATRPVGRVWSQA